MSSFDNSSVDSELLRTKSRISRTKPDQDSAHREDLSLSVDSDDAVGRLVGRGHEDGLGGDAVHVDAGAAFQIVEVDVAVLGDQVDHAMLLTNLEEMGITAVLTRGNIREFLTL